MENDNYISNWTQKDNVWTSENCVEGEVSIHEASNFFFVSGADGNPATDYPFDTFTAARKFLECTYCWTISLTPVGV